MDLNVLVYSKALKMAYIKHFTKAQYCTTYNFIYYFVANTIEL